MGTTAPSCKQTSCTKSRISSSPSPAFLLSSADTQSLFLHSTPNLQWSLCRRMLGQKPLSTTLILVRPMWGAMGPTRTPTVIRLRRYCLRTSASHTQRRLAGPKTRNTARGRCSRTAQGFETNVERVCFNVNELVCSLVEAIHYETLEETYQVQRCFTGKDRVCDTTYKIDTTTKDDYQCCNVETPNCFMEEKVINDVTCTNTVEFNCKREKTTKNDGYGQKEVVCTRTPKQDCYNIPRKIQVEVCKTDVHRYCEKFSNIFPFPGEEQNCRFEPKKICELQQKTRPKKAKKYSYTKDCKEQPREICDQCEKKSIQPVCDMQERLVCNYVPVESCSQEAKQYCHKVEKVVVEEICDMKFDTQYL